MNVFKKFFYTVKPSVCRFPAAVILSLAVSVLCSLDEWISSPKNPLILHYAVWCTTGFFVSIFVELLAEKILLLKKVPDLKKKIILPVLQALCIGAVFFPIKVIFANVDGSITSLSLWGINIALVIGIFFLLIDVHSDRKIIPVIISSFVIAVIAFVCVGAGLNVVALAVIKLILNDSVAHDYRIYENIWIFASIFFFSQIFLAYITKKDFEISKVHMVIFNYILFPIYVILLAVLYIYLIQSLVKRSMPHMNWFVSIATFSWFIFWFSLREYKNKAVEIFYKAGHFVLYPLVIIQIINFFERVNAYGFTASRVASLFYIVVSIVFIVLPLTKKCRAMKYSFVLFAVMFVVATSTPLNVERISIRSQENRIISVLSESGLYDNGNILLENASKILTSKQKNTIVASFDYILTNWAEEKTPFFRINAFRDSKKIYGNSRYDWKIQINDKSYLAYSDEKKIFMDLFGFEHLKNYDEFHDFSRLWYLELRSSSAEDDGPKYGVDYDSPVDVRNFETMYVAMPEDFSERDGRFYIRLNDYKKIDITEFVTKYLRHPGEGENKVERICPLTFEADGYTVYLYYISGSNYYNWNYELKEWRLDGRGFVFK